MAELAAGVFPASTNGSNEGERPPHTLSSWASQQLPELRRHHHGAHHAHLGYPHDAYKYSERSKGSNSLATSAWQWNWVSWVGG